MGFDTVYVNPFHLAGRSRSIYSIKDTTRMDPRLMNAPGDGDEIIKLFCDQAQRNDLVVMIDLVVNHAASDSVLLETRPELFAREPDGGLVTPWAADIGSESGKVFWHDLALFNYADPAIRRRLIDHWDAYVARFQDLGISSFRCDAAHMVPSDVWFELISRARRRDGSSVFVAETLGCTVERTTETAQVGFNYIMSNFAYSDLERLHALEEYESLHTLAPSVAFPESHDTDRLAARFDAEDRDIIARELIFRYRLAAFFSTGIMMPIGYEWGYRQKLDVAKSSPQDQEQTGIDIASDIADVNRLRRTLPPLNVEGAQTRLSRPDDPILLLLRGDENLMQHSQYASLVVANISDKPLRRQADSLLENAGSFERFVDHTPGRIHGELAGEITLSPREVRIFQGVRISPVQVIESS